MARKESDEQTRNWDGGRWLNHHNMSQLEGKWLASNWVRGIELLGIGLQQANAAKPLGDLKEFSAKPTPNPMSALNTNWED